MPGNSVYDTRFFIEYFLSDDKDTQRALKDEIRGTSERIVSAVTFHELYKINIEKLGRETANLRCSAIRDDFRVVNLGYDLAIEAAELSHKHRVPLADSVIAATALKTGSAVVSNDPHFKHIPGLKTRWPT
jgi:predicted nucleic acid-binding protein